MRSTTSTGLNPPRSLHAENAKTIPMASQLIRNFLRKITKDYSVFRWRSA